MAVDDKTRVSVTLTGRFLRGLNELVDKGVFLNQGEVIRGGLRLLFVTHKIKSFMLDDVIEPDEEVTPEVKEK